MSTATRKAGITLQLSAFRQRFILPKRGEKAALKRESRRLDRRLAKQELRSLDLSTQTVGDHDERPLLDLTRSSTGDFAYIGRR